MALHSADTDAAVVVELSSSIQTVSWAKPLASPGGIVGLEVSTVYVGNGAELQIELYETSGKKHGTFVDHISGNRFWAGVRVPDAARDAFYATVKLPKHGLSRTSPALLLTAPITLANVHWSNNEIERRETVQLHADVEGAPDGFPSEVSIWEHDEDGAHDLVARFPVVVEDHHIEAEWEFEYHDDVRTIPVESEMEQGYRPPEYVFRVEIGGIQAQSDRLTFKDWLELRVRDVNGEPVKDVEVTLQHPDGSEHQMKTDAEGMVRVDNALPGPYRVISYTLPDEGDD